MDSINTVSTPVHTVEFVTEAGMYNLILSSRKPKAKEFKHWLTHEVIPSIRKNGGYIMKEEHMSDRDRSVLDKRVREMTKEIADLKKERESLRKDMFHQEDIYSKLLEENVELVKKLNALKPAKRRGRPPKKAQDVVIKPTVVKSPFALDTQCVVKRNNLIMTRQEYLTYDKAR